MDNEDENSTELNALREEYAHHERNNARCRALLDHNRPLLTRSMCWRSVLEGMIGHKDGIDAGSDAKQKIEAPPIENERRRLLVEYVRAKGTVETFQLFVRQLAQPGVNGEIALKLAREFDVVVKLTSPFLPEVKAIFNNGKRPTGQAATALPVQQEDRQENAVQPPADLQQYGHAEHIVLGDGAPICEEVGPSDQDQTEGTDDTVPSPTASQTLHPTVYRDGTQLGNGDVHFRHASRRHENRPIPCTEDFPTTVRVSTDQDSDYPDFPRDSNDHSYQPQQLQHYHQGNQQQQQQQQ
eukprot:scpid78929/ scgid6108/ 